LASKIPGGGKKERWEKVTAIPFPTNSNAPVPRGKGEKKRRGGAPASGLLIKEMERKKKGKEDFFRLLSSNCSEEKGKGWGKGKNRRVTLGGRKGGAQ